MQTIALWILARLIFREQLGRRTPPWLFFKVDVCQRLAAVVADNKRRGNLTVQGVGKRCVIADLFGGVNFAEPENF